VKHLIETGKVETGSPAAGVVLLVRSIMVLVNLFTVAEIVLVPVFCILLFLPGRGQLLALAKDRLWLSFLVSALHTPSDYIAFATKQPPWQRPTIVNERFGALLVVFVIFSLAQVTIFGFVLLSGGLKVLAAVFTGCVIVASLDGAVMGGLGHGPFSAPACLVISPAVLLALALGAVCYLCL
jgi:hypothetical protein